MKTRNGFVSNSSSSSFIAIVTEAAFKEALSRLADREQKIISSIATDGTAFGNKVKVVKEFTDAGGGNSVWGCDYDDKEEVLEKAGVKIEDDDVEDEDWIYEVTSNYFGVIEKMSREKKWSDTVITQECGDGG